MLTGRLPFSATDPMEWVHCHIARKPATPAERLESVPTVISEIVMKLLAETAEERYHSPYSAALKELGNADRQEVGRRLNNRAENSHQPFRRRERGMQRFRSAKTLQKFSSVHAQVHNHFNQERHLITREICTQRRAAALGEWRALMA
jgi:hypothetical protein